MHGQQNVKINHVLLGDITHTKSHEPVGGASAVPDSKHNVAQPDCRISLA